ncbi:MAG: glycosyltransferase [Flavobacteriaceae bacterium]
MTFLIVTHTPHFQVKDKLFAYGPYVKEMNLWTKHVSKVVIVAPYDTHKLPDAIFTPYAHEHLEILPIPSISITSPLQLLKTVVFLPFIFFQLLKAMRKSDHIHLRCPGNIGLLGALAQTFFPKKPKTAKYAGNWDPKAKQPISYQIQKWWLSNRFFSKKMHVLVYGSWPNQSQNVVSFFTATYSQQQVPPLLKKSFKGPFRFLFVGSLSPGKRPLYAVSVVEELRNLGMDCTLDLYGEGKERTHLENYIAKNTLGSWIQLKGNRSSNEIEEAYKNSHFLVLPSKSEGWPKVVAEAMFWGIVPMVTKISCVPWMLKEGKRGVLLEAQLESDIPRIMEVMKDEHICTEMSIEGQQWSHRYTLDTFEREIKKLLK